RNACSIPRCASPKGGEGSSGAGSAAMDAAVDEYSERAGARSRSGRGIYRVQSRCALPSPRGGLRMATARPRRGRPEPQANPTLNRAARSGEPTQDEKLLTWCEPEREREALFTESDTWRIMRIMGEFVHGFDELAAIGPAVTVFGSARVGPSDPWYAVA